MYYNTTDSAHFYRTYSGGVDVLDYESMTTSSLCNKPNCKHSSTDCIVQRLNGNVPMLSETKAYYFIDDEPSIEEGEDGKPFLKLGSTLYCFDFAANIEEKLFYIDGVSVANSCYGWLLHEGSIYFIGNHYRKIYDENGILTQCTGTGGEMKLYSVNLETQEMQNFGDLYNPTELAKYYPATLNSGEVYMEGVFDNKIYFNVAFVADASHTFYVTSFDLKTKTYSGEPENYNAIFFEAVAFASNDYLAISSNQKATVYRKGESEPIVFRDDTFNDYSQLSVFDDVIYFNGKAYMLKTGEVRTVDRLTDKQVVAKYGDSYIVSDVGMQSGFEKIPVSELLPV